MNLVKDEAKKLIEKLPDSATWDDIMYELFVKKRSPPASRPPMKAALFP